MARIPDSVLVRLKSEVSLVRLAEAAGLELQRHGSADFITRCPWHDDDTRSLVISPEKNLWHCLGACQHGGSVIDWVMKDRGIGFRDAVQWMLDDCPIDAGPPAAEPSRAAKKEKTSGASKAERSPEAQQALEDAVVHYHQTLLESLPC